MANKQQKQEPAPARSDTFRLAEIFHIRRVERYDMDGSIVWYQCNLCMAKADPGNELQHYDYCPVLRLK
jgi:hypothetical protein